MMMESTVDMPPPPSLEKETKVLPTTESDLRDKLDTLILEYLNLIDTYQTLQSQINNSFSSVSNSNVFNLLSLWNYR